MARRREQRWYLGGQLLAFGLWAAASFLSLSQSVAATKSWTGSVNSTWSTSGNWSPSGAPGQPEEYANNPDIASFGSSFTSSNQPNITSNMTLGQIAAISSLAKDVTITTTGSNYLILSGISGVAVDQQSNYMLTLAGDVRFRGAQTINVGNGTAPIDLDITANLIDMWGTSLTKTGAGTMRLSGNNTFQGTLSILGGTVIAASNTALGTAVNWNNTIASGAALHLTGGVTLTEGSFDLAGSGPDGLGALRSLAGNNTLNAALTSTGALTIGVNAGAGLTVNGQKVFNHATTLNAGAGSTLSFTGATTFGQTSAINVGTGANFSMNGPTTIGGVTTLTNNGTTTISGSQFQVDANLNVAGTGNTTISSNQIAGTGTINKTGSGTLLFNGSGTFSTYAMNVLEGTVELDRLFNPANQQGLSIGTTSGPAASVKLLSNEKLRDDLLITIRESGTFNLNNKNESVAALSFYGGTVNTGTGMLTLANAGGDVITANASTQTASINGKLELAQDNLQAVTMTVADSALATELNINAAISQKNTGIQTLLVKSGAGTLEFSGSAANTYTGITRVDAGTLKLNKTAGVDAIAGGTIELNSGGTLLLANANQINNSVNLKLNGGTFKTGTTTGFADKLGTLTLSANSVIDLGSGVHWLEFAASNATTWNGSATLTIYDWAGVAGTAGTQGRIFVGTNLSGLTSAQLAQISFNGFGVGAMLLSNGELVPIAIPEAHVIVAALLILAALTWRERRALKPILAKLRMPARLT